MRVTCDTCKYAKIEHTILANGTIIETRTPVCECEYEDRCSKAAHGTLQAQVDSLCKGRKKGKQCNAKMTKYELFANAMKFQACAIARDAINQKCYGGGDDGHREQAANNMRAYGKCMEFYNSKP